MNRLQIVGRDAETPLWVTKYLYLYFKFAILIRQNKCNHLLFYVVSFIQFCLLLSV